ncbi:ATP-binding cassette domain-containing protein [Streptomyces sp. NPDC021093]|uniref:ATP-binding cassette domain-containing protein n=1 Tax=Streptomyces sp. NPDC021093 TaxID=3365112 RepID=UPI00379F647A
MDSPHTGTAVTAVNFGLKGPRGWAFRGVECTAPAGSFIAIEGPSGSGRTCLLLALTGRMRATEGHAEVGGLRLPKKMAGVRRVSALGPVAGVSELDSAFTVAEHLRERALLQRRFDGSLRSLLRRPSVRRAAARARIDAALAAAGLDLASLPKGERTSVRDLERLEALRLSVGLALMSSPQLIAVDDADLKLSDAERAQAWELLRSVADAGTTVLAVCSEPPADALRISTATDASRGDGATGADTSAGATTGTDAGTDAGTAADAAAATGAAKNTTQDTTEKGTADAFAETGRS